jgi:hypothetical protein
MASFKLTGPSNSPKFTGHALYAGTIEIDDKASKKTLLSPSIQVSVPAPQSLLSKAAFIASRGLPILSCDEQTEELPLANDTASVSLPQVVGNSSLVQIPTRQGATLSYTGALAVEIFCVLTQSEHLQLPQAEVRRNHV